MSLALLILLRNAGGTQKATTVEKHIQRQQGSFAKQTMRRLRKAYELAQGMGAELG